MINYLTNSVACTITAYDPRLSKNHILLFSSSYQEVNEHQGKLFTQCLKLIFVHNLNGLCRYSLEVACLQSQMICILEHAFKPAVGNMPCNPN